MPVDVSVGVETPDLHSRPGGRGQLSLGAVADKKKEGHTVLI